MAFSSMLYKSVGFLLVGHLYQSSSIVRTSLLFIMEFGLLLMKEHLSRLAIAAIGEIVNQRGDAPAAWESPYRISATPTRTMGNAVEPTEMEILQSPLIYIGIRKA